MNELRSRTQQADDSLTEWVRHAGADVASDSGRIADAVVGSSTGATQRMVRRSFPRPHLRDSGSDCVRSTGCLKIRHGREKKRRATSNAPTDIAASELAPGMAARRVPPGRGPATIADCFQASPIFGFHHTLHVRSVSKMRSWGVKRGARNIPIGQDHPPEGQWGPSIFLGWSYLRWSSLPKSASLEKPAGDRNYMVRIIIWDSWNLATNAPARTHHGREGAQREARPREAVLSVTTAWSQNNI